MKQRLLLNINLCKVFSKNARIKLKMSEMIKKSEATEFSQRNEVFYK